MGQTFWTIESLGVEKTIAEWGIDDFTAEFISQAEETVELSASGRRFDAAFLFPYKSTVVVRRDRKREGDGFEGGSFYFTGIVAHPTVGATGKREFQRCSLIGPWWYLNERAFEHEYNVFNGWAGGDPNNGPTFITKTTNRIFLNQSIDLVTHPDAKLNTGEQLLEILNWTLKPFVDENSAPPFQIGELGLAVNVPVDEVKNITCAEAARKMFRWSPDAVQWFDHTTSPPTFHCKRRVDLLDYTLDINAVPPTNIQCIPRYDVQRPFVKIIYERTNTVNGFSWYDPITRVYPDPPPSGLIDQFSGVPFTVDLRGFTVSTTTVEIKTRTLNTNDSDWWLSHLPELKFGLDQSNFRSVTFEFPVEIETEESEDLLGLPNELVGGPPSSPVLIGGAPAAFQRITVKTNAKVVTSSGDSTTKPVHVQIVATNATSGSFTSDSGSQAGDAIPENLERDFYDAVSVLSWEGSLAFRQNEIGGLPRVGHRLNIVGSDRTELATMNALVQRVRETLRGETEVEFGPPPHLSVDDLVSLFRVTRNREIRNPFTLRSGYSGRPGNLNFGHHSPRTNSGATTGYRAVVVASGSPTPNSESDPDKQGKITHDGELKKSEWVGAPGEGKITLTLGPSGRLKTTQGKDLYPIEYDVCVLVNGVKTAKKAIFIASAPY